MSQTGRKMRESTGNNEDRIEKRPFRRAQHERCHHRSLDRLRVLVGILGIWCGLGIFLYPDIASWIQREQGIRGRIRFALGMELEETRKEENGEAGTGGEAEETTLWTDSLHSQICSYNQCIFRNGQEDFSDALSVTQTPELWSEYAEEEFGYLEIPAMDVTLPIYIGATESHMAKGAAVLGGTSFPVGGINTNSVIAGHRGYRGMPYFREIEKLTEGDCVYITNAWEQLCYRVESIGIIAPEDSDYVKIQEGRDMITLLTCHPYRSHGKYRYVVYCVRDTDGEKAETGETQDGGTTAGSPEMAASDGTVFRSSEGDIQREKYFRRGCALLLLGMIAGTVCRKFREK